MKKPPNTDGLGGKVWDERWDQHFGGNSWSSRLAEG
jgi:hypothetical protein